jgi:hypothetical protein
MTLEQPQSSEHPFARPENEKLLERGFVPGATVVLSEHVPFEVWEHLAEKTGLSIAETPEILRAHAFFILGYSQGNVQLFLEGIVGNLYISEEDLSQGFEVRKKVAA